MKRFACTFICSAAMLAAQTKPAGTPKKDAFVNGAPLTLQQTIKLLHQSAIPLARRKEAIQARGLDFLASPEVIEKLKGAGASDDMLKVIKGKAKQLVAELPPIHTEPVAPPAPPRQPEGSLKVNCGPEECEVSLNGTSRGKTTNGSLEVSGLTPGEWAIDFKSEGYVSRQATVTVEDEKTAAIAAVLDPNRATQEAFGTQVLGKMVQALGGEGALRDMASVQATGTTTVWTCDGRSAAWKVLMRNRMDRALFQAMYGKGYLQEVLFMGGEPQLGKKKVNDAAQIATNLALIRDHQISMLVAKISAAPYKLVANHATPAAGEEFNLIAEGSGEKILIALDSELLPKRVRVEKSSGKGSVEVAYSDFTKDGKARFPKSMEVKPEGWDHSVDMKFDRVDLSPALNDNDYKLRGKRLMNLTE